MSMSQLLIQRLRDLEESVVGLKKMFRKMTILVKMRVTNIANERQKSR